MKITTRFRWLRLAFLVGVAFGAVPIRADNWPAWRGPTGQGNSREKGLPTVWDRTNNIRWRIALPARGNSTPVVWGPRVFVTQAIASEHRRTVMCFDRQDGRLRWQSGCKWEADESTHATNPQNSSSPVTDGERVIAWFGSAGVYCYDLDGQELWHRELGPQKHIWGWGSSPVIHGDLCLLNFGPGERQFFIALNKRTGERVWQVDEPGGNSGEPKPGEKAVWVGSWSTPLIVPVAGRDEAVLSLPNRVAGFDLSTGKERWTCTGLNPLVYTSPLYADGVVVVMGGFNGKALAVRTGGSGDVTATNRLWHHPQTKQRIGSGVIHEGHIYILNDPGIAECIELTTGKVIWAERVPAKAKTGVNWSSLVLADGHLYATSQGGDTFVLKASPKFEVVAVNPLGELSNSSLAISDGDLFLRTDKALWCIGKR